MWTRTRSAILLMITAAMCAVADAQDCVNIQSNTVTCGNQQGQTCPVTVYTFIGSQCGAYPGPYNYVNCCSTLIASATSIQGGCCYTAGMLRPETRQQLAEFALMQPVLISDCEGRYQPYTEIRPKEPEWNPSSSKLRISLN